MGICEKTRAGPGLQALAGNSSGQGSHSSQDEEQREDKPPAVAEDSGDAAATRREHLAEQRRFSKMDKAARMREKNKIAQKRWRERQKVGLQQCLKTMRSSGNLILRTRSLQLECLWHLRLRLQSPS